MARGAELSGQGGKFKPRQFYHKYMVSFGIIGAGIGKTKRCVPSPHQGCRTQMATAGQLGTLQISLTASGTLILHAKWMPMVSGGHHKDIVDWGLPRDRHPPASYMPAPTLPHHRMPPNSTHTVPSSVPSTPPGHTGQELDASSVTSSQRAHTAGVMAT